MSVQENDPIQEDVNEISEQKTEKQNDDLKQDDLKQDDLKQDALKQDDLKQDDLKQDDLKQDDDLEQEGGLERTESEQEDNEVEELKRALENEKEQSQANLDTVLRKQAADLDNLRKRTTRDIENAHKYALDKFVKELLPIIDSLELGISASKIEGAENIDNLKEGMNLTLKMFKAAIDKFGVKPLAPQIGEKFNPDQHQAVSMQDIEDAESGGVVTVVQKGYELNGRLIRPAMVIVAK